MNTGPLRGRPFGSWCRRRRRTGTLHAKRCANCGRQGWCCDWSAREGVPVRQVQAHLHHEAEPELPTLVLRQEQQAFNRTDEGD